MGGGAYIRIELGGWEECVGVGGRWGRWWGWGGGTSMRDRTRAREP